MTNSPVHSPEGPPPHEEPEITMRSVPSDGKDTMAKN